MVEKTNETIIRREDKKEAEEVMEFLGTLSKENKEKFREFLRGAKFMQSILGKKAG